MRKNLTLINMKKMKGLGYELGLFVVVLFVLIFLWIVGYGVFNQISATMNDMVNDSTVKNNINIVDKVVYYSLFFITIAGFIWLVKVALKNKENET